MEMNSKKTKLKTWASQPNFANLWIFLEDGEHREHNAGENQWKGNAAIAFREYFWGMDGWWFCAGKPGQMELMPMEANTAAPKHKQGPAVGIKPQKGLASSLTVWRRCRGTIDDKFSGKGSEQWMAKMGWDKWIHGNGWGGKWQLSGHWPIILQNRLLPVPFYGAGNGPEDEFELEGKWTENEEKWMNWRNNDRNFLVVKMSRWENSTQRKRRTWPKWGKRASIGGKSQKGRKSLGANEHCQ
jgi:hypothetical protein